MGQTVGLDQRTIIVCDECGREIRGYELGTYVEYVGWINIRRSNNYHATTMDLMQWKIFTNRHLCRGCAKVREIDNPRQPKKGDRGSVCVDCGSDLPERHNGNRYELIGWVLRERGVSQCKWAEY